MIVKHEPDVYRAIEVLVANLAMQVNVKYNIEPHQAPDIARGIYKKYYFYSIEEIAIVLRKGGEGELGQIYDRLSKDIILKWFIEYDTRFRDQLVNSTRQQINNEYEQGQEEISTILGPAIAKIIEKMDKEDQEATDKEKNYKAFKEEYFKSKNEKPTE